MALVPKTFRKKTNLCSFTAVISKSRDGNWLDALLRVYPNTDTLRVAHNARPKALLEMIDRLRNPKVALMITPDGPRGPRHKMKVGPIVAAKESGAPILLFNWKSSKSFLLSSWDRFEIPKPFSQIEVTISEPIYLDKTVDTKEEMERLEQLLTSFYPK
jgi:lysophospholipid acyltransferase (LPLAT)-like uncharacterized protein